MPEIDLKPTEYRKRDHKGVWHIADDPKVAVIGLVMSVAALVFLFVTRDQGSSAAQFGCTALFAFCAGGCFKMLLGTRY